jgi:hypothetical protein
MAEVFVVTDQGVSPGLDWNEYANAFRNQQDLSCGGVEALGELVGYQFIAHDAAVGRVPEEPLSDRAEVFFGEDAITPPLHKDELRAAMVGLGHTSTARLATRRFLARARAASEEVA